MIEVSSFRFEPFCAVAADAIEYAGDTTPDRSQGGIADYDLIVEGLGGGRMLVLLAGASAC